MHGVVLSSLREDAKSVKVLDRTHISHEVGLPGRTNQHWFGKAQTRMVSQKTHPNQELIGYKRLPHGSEKLRTRMLSQNTPKPRVIRLQASTTASETKTP